MTSSGRNTQYAAEWLHGNGIMRWRRVYPGRLDQVSQARSWSAMLLADTDRADDAALIVTELSSNALLHSRSGEPGGWFGVEITRGHHVCITVHDLGGRHVPLMTSTTTNGRGAEEDAAAEHGRGLRAVWKLAAQVGISGSPDSGHAVWALLTNEPGDHQFQQGSPVPALPPVWARHPRALRGVGVELLIDQARTRERKDPTNQIPE